MYLTEAEVKHVLDLAHDDIVQGIIEARCTNEETIGAITAFIVTTQAFGKALGVEVDVPNAAAEMAAAVKARGVL